MRVATEDQADRGTIEAQRDFLRQFASLYQLPVAGEYADDGVTGTLSLGGRPEGQRFLQDAEAGAFGCGGVYVGQNAGNRNGMEGAYSRCGRRHPDSVRACRNGAPPGRSTRRGQNRPSGKTAAR